MASSSKPYKTLPGPLRPRQSDRHTDRKKTSQEHPHSPLFGLNLNLNISSLISSGVSFWDNLRRKTPTPSTPTPYSGRISMSSHSSSSESPQSPREFEEHIEMVPFQHTEVVGKGEGHDWEEGGSHNPTWCDLCGELIWGLYDTGTWVCSNCNYTAHLKCRDRVTLNCSVTLSVSDDTDGIVQSLCFDESVTDADIPSISSYATAAESLLASESATLTLPLPTTSTTTSGVFHTLGDEATVAPSSEAEFYTLQGEEEEEEDDFYTLKGIEELSQDEESVAGPGKLLLALPPQELENHLSLYNSQMPAGQHTVFDTQENLFKGFIRVEMNLQRPINVLNGARPPSFYNIIKEDTICDRTLTTFYLPPSTEKALHITSHTTTQDVIRCLLKKFKVADNPHKYALYEKCEDPRRDSSGNVPNNKSLSRPKMRRMGEEEKPLVFAIMWGAKNPRGQKKFVLQENDPGEIVWERFSLPELKNFLLILDREEAWYKRRIHEKYEAVQEEIHTLLQAKK